MEQTKNRKRGEYKKSSLIEVRKLHIENILMFTEIGSEGLVDLKSAEYKQYPTKRQSIKAFNTHFYRLRLVFAKDRMFKIEQATKDKNDFCIKITRTF